jgi:dihydrofolate reductase
MGSAQTIRQALAASLVDELTVIVASVILGTTKQLFDGISDTVEFQQLGVRQSEFATFLDYRA